MKYRTLGEYFEYAKTLTKNADKIAGLREHASPMLYYLLKLAFAEDVKWLVPEGTPPFKQDPGPVGITPSTLGRELRSLYLFLEGGNPNLNQFRRETLFIQFLERLHPSEAELIISIKDKTFATKYKCSKKIVQDAFPGLLELPTHIQFGA